LKLNSLVSIFKEDKKNHLTTKSFSPQFFSQTST
jgi:hypothetical protein